MQNSDRLEQLTCNYDTLSFSQIHRKPSAFMYVAMIGFDELMIKCRYDSTEAIKHSRWTLSLFL